MSVYSIPYSPCQRQVLSGKRYHIQVPREEVGFITMHLSSARVWPQSRKNRGQMKSVNARQVVLSIVDSVEQELNLPFHTCTRMIEELTSHMDSMISRLSMNIHLDNTQVEEIQNKYPDIYAAVERACNVFRTMLQIQDVSPSEITFVAMHFVAAAETMRVEQTRVVVAVVCPSGMGASRMLAATDRLVSPLNTALKYGLPVDKLVMGIGAALRYNNPEDPQSVELQQKIAEKGVTAAFAEVSGVTDQAVLDAVTKAYDEVMTLF